MESGTTETKDAVCVRRGRIAGYESGLCACVVPRLCIACPLFVRTALALLRFFCASPVAAARRTPPRSGVFLHFLPFDLAQSPDTHA